MVGVSGTCTNCLENSRLPDSTIWGLEGEEIVKIEVYLSYEWVIGS